MIEAAWETPQPGKRDRAITPLLDDRDDDDDAEHDGDAGTESDGIAGHAGFGVHGRLRYTQCCNAPIQGACADVIMIAMISIDRALREADIDGGLVLSVHDELVIEVTEDRADDATMMLQRSMEQAFALVFPRAPLTGLLKLGRGRTWTGAK